MKKGLVTALVIGIIALGGLAVWLATGGSDVVGTYWSSLTGTYMAKVNGEVITTKELDKWVQLQKKQYESQGIQFNDENAVTELKKYVLSDLIDYKLIMQEVKKRNITPTEADVEKTLKDQKQQAFQGDEAKFQEFLKSQGLTEKFLRESLLLAIAQSKLYENVTTEPTLTEEMKQDFYAKNKDQFTVLAQVQVSHILLKTEEEAKQVIQQLQNKGNFEQLATEKSQDTTAKTNKGSLGYKGKDELAATIGPEFSTAAFSLKKGEFTTVPVKSTAGFHVIRVTDIKGETTQSYDEVKETIKENLVLQMKNEQFVNFFNELRSKAQIENKLGTPETPAGQ